MYIHPYYARNRLQKNITLLKRTTLELYNRAYDTLHYTTAYENSRATCETIFSVSVSLRSLL